MQQPNPRIVVGVDGSPEANSALVFASHQASRMGADLEVVLVWDLFDQPPAGARFDPKFTEHDAETVLHDLVTAALGASPGVTIVERVVCDRPVPALLDASDGAAMVVVGARGIGGFLGLHLGSVSDHVVAHADCPVAVIPSGWSPSEDSGYVLVGTDGSSAAEVALHWAAQDAARRDTTAMALMVWMPLVTATGPLFTMPVDEEAFEAAARARLEHQIAGLPEVERERVVPALVCGTAAASILAAAEKGPAIIVVGTRGLGGFSGLLLGSVARQVVHHSPRPVVTVPRSWST